MRQHRRATFDPTPGVSIATLAYDYVDGHRVAEHFHSSDQVIYATTGVMEISSARSRWIIPPTFAVWIPARTPHRIRMTGRVSMRTLYLRSGLAARVANAAADACCTVLGVTPLLRELVLEAVRLGDLRDHDRIDTALCDLVLRELEQAARVPISLSMPKERRANHVARAALATLAEPRALSSLCADAGASVRTIERIFRREVGVGFAAWRRQARLMAAIERLMSGASVKETAHAVGYQQPSAFVAMFRGTMGATPLAWRSRFGV